jgi:hypothetical protein
VLSLSSPLTRSRSYTEKDWNEDSIPHVEKNGLESNGGESYRASKTLAEQAFWSERIRLSSSDS